MSAVAYTLLEPTAQALVVACPISRPVADVRGKWATRAAAILGDGGDNVRGVVRDLLANPQIRVIVFDGPACGRAAWDAFWYGADLPAWKIEPAHLTLVRSFVTLYDDDFGIRGALQPFWPKRLTYVE